MPQGFFIGFTRTERHRGVVISMRGCHMWAGGGRGAHTSEQLTVRPRARRLARRE